MADWKSATQQVRKPALPGRVPGPGDGTVLGGKDSSGGVCSSSSTATSNTAAVGEFSKTLTDAEVAATEDGRTPAYRRINRRRTVQILAALPVLGRSQVGSVSALKRDKAVCSLTLLRPGRARPGGSVKMRP